MYLDQVDLDNWTKSHFRNQKFTANVVVGLFGNESPDSNRFTLVTPKAENGVRLQATFDNQNPTGLPVGAVRYVDSKKLKVSSLRASPKIKTP